VLHKNEYGAILYDRGSRSPQKIIPSGGEKKKRKVSIEKKKKRVFIGKKERITRERGHKKLGGGKEKNSKDVKTSDALAK